MISQLLSQSTTPPARDPDGAQPAKGTEAGAQGAFPLVLAMLGGAVRGKHGDGAGGEIGEDSAVGDAVAAMVPGVALPELAGTGKILPDDAETLPDGSAEAATLALTVLAPQIIAAGAAEAPGKGGPATASAAPHPAGLPLPVQQLVAGTADKPAKGERVPPAVQPAVSIQVAPAPGSNEAVPRSPVLAADRPAIHPHANPQSAPASGDRPAQQDLAGGERTMPDMAPKMQSKPVADPAPMQLVAPSPAAPAVEAASPSPAADKPALETGIARELGRIVDSLASAREALTARGATLALDHAEFGELSLRFDQRRDGQLAVHLAATDPDAHRAVAAAVADRPAFAQPDGSQQNPQTGGNGAARGSLAEREGSSAQGNGPDRERQDQRPRADPGAAGTNTRGDGSAIYA